ncbi:transposase [Deinococcus aquatilis]|uniref:transposase n=1 Tax=Deinococcus aquatilis TaxID=519440 RepID=UPI000A053764|nr:transposase [Deinococcus aquatilis]
MNAWLRAARESGFRDVRTFAVGLTRERAALLTAVTLPWSNGKAEGIVNRIKLVKRQMYGRESFELLRRRVLLAA